MQNSIQHQIEGEWISLLSSNSAITKTQYAQLRLLRLQEVLNHGKKSPEPPPIRLTEHLKYFGERLLATIIY